MGGGLAQQEQSSPPQASPVRKAGCACARRWERLGSRESIGYNDIPWPASTDYEQYLLALSRTGDKASGCQQRADRRAYAAACLRWHPDKFAHRYGRKLVEADRNLVLSRVQQIAQGINAAWSSVQESELACAT